MSGQLVAAAIAERARQAIGSEYRQSGCLEAVYAWCGSPDTDQPKGRYPSAIASYRETLDALDATVLRMDWREAPAGAIHYWDGNPGHVALGTGNGLAVTTNAPQRVSSTRNGVRFALVGEQTIDRISRGRGRYLGWALWAFDHTITLAATAGDDPKEIDVTLTTKQAEQLDAIHNELTQRLPVLGGRKDKPDTLLGYARRGENQSYWAMRAAQEAEKSADALGGQPAPAAPGTGITAAQLDTLANKVAGIVLDQLANRLKE